MDRIEFDSAFSLLGSRYMKTQFFSFNYHITIQAPFGHLKNPRCLPPPIFLGPGDDGCKIATHVRDAPAVHTVAADLVRDIHGPLEAGIASAHDSLSEVVETVVHVRGCGVLVAQIVSEESGVADAEDVLFVLCI